MQILAVRGGLGNECACCSMTAPWIPVVYDAPFPYTVEIKKAYCKGTLILKSASMYGLTLVQVYDRAVTSKLVRVASTISSCCNSKQKISSRLHYLTLKLCLTHIQLGIVHEHDPENWQLVGFGTRYQFWFFDMWYEWIHRSVFVWMCACMHATLWQKHSVWHDAIIWAPWLIHICGMHAHETMGPSLAGQRHYDLI